MPRLLLTCLGLLCLLCLTGCQSTSADPSMATPPYPAALHTTTTADIQVLRDGPRITLVNATAHSYRDFDLWLNQRYMHSVTGLRAGESLELQLTDFFDERGERINAGGLFRTYEPTRIRLAEIAPGDGQPMIGLLVIRPSNEGREGR